MEYRSVKKRGRPLRIISVLVGLLVLAFAVYPAEVAKAQGVCGVLSIPESQREQNSDWTRFNISRSLSGDLGSWNLKIATSSDGSTRVTGSILPVEESTPKESTIPCGESLCTEKLPFKIRFLLPDQTSGTSILEGTRRIRITITFPGGQLNPGVIEIPQGSSGNTSAPDDSVSRPEPGSPQPEEGSKGESSQPNSFLTDEEQKMLELVNKERERAGLSPLVADQSLTRLARLKSRDMIEKDYFSHTSPTYGTPFDMMKEAGVKYMTAGENLAGDSTVERAHTGLMNSEGHRRNILNPSFKKIGIGIIEGGPYGLMFTQMFTG